MSKITDPIADYLTRLRNAIQAKHRVVEIPASNLKKEMTKLLKEKGYILNYKFEDEVGYQGNIKIALKYNPETKVSAIKALERISKPGLRQYCHTDEYSTSTKWFGNSNYLYIERCNNRQRSSRAKCWWRSIMLRVLKGGKSCQE